MATWQNHASRVQWSRKCRSSLGVMTPHEVQPVAAPGTRSAGRILVVDDHEDNIELLRARLEAWGYQVETAKDGQEALDAVAAKPPDLILLDVMMPSVDGNEVA